MNHSIMAIRRKMHVLLKSVAMNALLIVIGVNVASAVFCRAGRYYDRKNQDCHACPDGMFMHYDSHQQITCFFCRKPESHLHEIAVKHCTPTANTVIRCTKGYFWHDRGDRMRHRGSCTRCTSCQAEGQFVVKECDELSDAFCCPEPNMVIADKRNAYGAFVCKKRTDAELTTEKIQGALEYLPAKKCIPREIGCTRNERMVSLNAGNEAVCCEPCPEDTFVAELSHTRSTCLSCWDEIGNLRPECGGEESASPNKNNTPDDSHSLFPQDSNATRDEDTKNVYIAIGVVAAIFVY